ncbi:MAG: asparagine synthase (glutamine-hydrolyzing), partial [Pirellulaceae bacterium]|nr:asparagine synthase (glutamine-hydrolyzing) [Pirellulaceae bacterium]
MCGIVGGTNTTLDYEAAIQAIRHRGPDHQRVLRWDDLALAFARLSIVDLRAIANQPMSACDEKVWIVFNGEIYGYRELRSRLESLGHQFRTNSDTEVLLTAYLQWGEDFVDNLDGMFSIAIYDRRDRRLRLYRDRAGIKPLYYYWDGEHFAFASELKAIESLFPDSLTVDQTALYDFLTYHYVPSPKSLYRNIFKLEPGSCLRFSVARQVIEHNDSYWSIDPAHQRPEMTIDLAAERVRSLIAASVTDQLVADVPVGAFLSGGVDSSVVTLEATRTTPGLKTYSIGFDSMEESETVFASEVATACDSDHTEELVDAETVENLFGRLRSWYDEPFADTSAYPTYCVARIARRDVTVALSGDGGDEVFGGYTRFQRCPQFQKFGIRWTRLDRPLERLKILLRNGSVARRACNLAALGLHDPIALYVKFMGGMTAGEKVGYGRALEIPNDYDDYWKFRRYWRNDLPWKTRLQYLDFKTYLPDDILTKVDRVSMANSLEVRVPLLSRSLIEFAFSLPERIRYYEGLLKGCLKYAYRDQIANHILHREKQGFSIP